MTLLGMVGFVLFVSSSLNADIGEVVGEDKRPAQGRKNNWTPFKG